MRTVEEAIAHAQGLMPDPLIKVGVVDETRWLPNGEPVGYRHMMLSATVGARAELPLAWADDGQGGYDFDTDLTKTALHVLADWLEHAARNMRQAAGTD